MGSKTGSRFFATIDFLLPKKNKMNTPQVQTESRIQSDAFTWHWNTFPQERGQLFMVYNNPKNAAHGSILKAMGMLAGVSDLIYLPGADAVRAGRVVFLECKKPGGKQSPEQKEFERRVRSLGFDYELFHSLQEFQEIVQRYRGDHLSASDSPTLCRGTITVNPRDLLPLPGPVEKGGTL